MATPEIKLPREESDQTAHNEQPSIKREKSSRSTWEDGKPDNESRSQSILPDAVPIVYRYLTFETELPCPTSLGPTYDGSPIPQAPDLRNYVSPFTWSKSRKSFTTWLSCLITVVTAYTAGAYSPASDQLTEYWGVSQTAILIGITTFTTGFATAPMVLAPFSELNGRRPVFIATGVLFVVCQICCAVTRSYPGMLLARFFAGVGGSTFSTMVGGVVSDIYHTEDRNTPMALFSGAALFGTGLGPLVSGFIAQRLLWRWVFYVQVITCGLFILAVVLFFKETRGSVLLSRRAGLLNQWYEAREQVGLVGVDVAVGDDGKKETQRLRWKVKSDEERESLGKMIGISIYRPFHLLLTEPVVFFFSLWVAFSWAVLYLTFSAIPLVFTTNHNFNVEQSGAVFTSMCIGAALATVVSIYQEKIARHYGKLSSTPEGRLYFSCIESALLPIGLFWFGWSSFSSIHWIVPTIAVGVATMGIFSVYLAVFNYLADTYHRYASSALAAQSFCRNMLGGVFPLVTSAMFHRMTFAGASSFLGGVGALLTIVPWVLVFFGPKIRARSKFASVSID
ncbi:hypothetical protein ACLMJK_006086 [Lecanora helva]